jgi:hypothetical protein
MASAVADHGQIDEGFAVASVALVVSHEAACFDEPAEGALNHPASGQEDEALGLVAALDDRKHQSLHMPINRRCGGEKAFELPRVRNLQSAKMMRSVKNSGQNRPNTNLAASRSCTLAGVTKTPKSSPCVSVRI